MRNLTLSAVLLTLATPAAFAATAYDRPNEPRCEVLRAETAVPLD